MIYGSIKMKDAKGGITSCRIQNPSGVTELQNIAAELESHSNAVWTAVRMDTENESPGTPTDAEYRSATTKAILTFRNETDEIFKVSIPAPANSIFEYNGRKVTVSAAVGNSVATILTNNTTNGTLTFLQGKLWHRPTKR